MTPQQPLELILLRQVASYLAVAMWMMDESGDLIYYNEPAEALLGVRFDDVGTIRAEQLMAMWQVTDREGNEIADSDFPVVVALMERMPAHRVVRFQGMDGVWREVEVTAIPIEGQGGRFLGVLATFWEAGT